MARLARVIAGLYKSECQEKFPEGEVSLQVPKNLFKKCIKKHPPAKNKGGGGPSRKKVVEPTLGYSPN
jgi:hypothetical protein